MPGYGLRRVRFRRPVPLAEGFARAEAAIQAAGRPPTAFCACELRSPGQFSEDGFRRFNESYVDTLSRWGIYDGETTVSVGRMTLPIARSWFASPPAPCLAARSVGYSASTDMRPSR